MLLILFVPVSHIRWKYYTMASYFATLPNYFQWHQTGCSKISHSEYLYHGSQLKLKIYKLHKIINTGGGAGMPLHELVYYFVGCLDLRKRSWKKYLQCILNLKYIKSLSVTLWIVQIFKENFFRCWKTGIWFGKRMNKISMYILIISFSSFSLKQEKTSANIHSETTLIHPLQL